MNINASVSVSDYVARENTLVYLFQPFSLIIHITSKLAQKCSNHDNVLSTHIKLIVHNRGTMNKDKGH